MTDTRPSSARPRSTRRFVPALVAASLAVTPFALRAQQSAGAIDASRAPGQSRLSVGVIMERVSFGTGIVEADLGGADSSRVLSATGLALPIQFSTILGRVWMIDAGTSFTSGTRKSENPATGVAASDDQLSGIGDIRLRISRRFDGSGLRFTVGANLPTGVVNLDDAQTRALSVLGSPALGMTQPAVGYGAGATLGVVKSFAATSRQWGLAVGASMEWRGAYEPYAALAAGTSVNDYDPGEVIRLSAGATRLFGESKGLVTASLDLFGADQVTPGTGITPTEIKIGPTFQLDAQWLPGTTRLRNAALFAGLRVRSALSRDGVSLPESGNMMFEAGARGGRALTSGADLVFELSGRVLTAVEIDNRLATAASTSIAPAIGLAFSRATWTLQPMLTARMGTVDTGISDGSFTVLGARVMLERRF